MRATNKLLTVLSKAERSALYDLPDFDDAQRQEYLTFTESEQQHNKTRCYNRIYCH